MPCYLANVREGQVRRCLTKLLDELAGVPFVARSRQLVMDCEAHVVSLAFMVQRLGQSVTGEMPVAERMPSRSWLRAELAGRCSRA